MRVQWVCQIGSIRTAGMGGVERRRQGAGKFVVVEFRALFIGVRGDVMYVYSTILCLEGMEI